MASTARAVGEQTIFLNAFWSRVFRSAVLPAAILAAMFVGIRVGGTLGPRQLRWLLPLGFVLMAAVPWIFLASEGRRHIGLSRPAHFGSYPLAALAGAVAACACFAIGFALFGHGDDNFFVSIAGSYRSTMDTQGMGLVALHLIFTIPALLFSPIGEEIFFRGFLQEALQARFGTAAATHLEAALFGLVHLCHHGLMVTALGLALRPASGGLWVVLMFLVAHLFAAIRRSSGSLYPAMVSHMAFNAAMNIWIFSRLWQ